MQPDCLAFKTESFQDLTRPEDWSDEISGVVRFHNLRLLFRQMKQHKPAIDRGARIGHSIFYLPITSAWRKMAYPPLRAAVSEGETAYSASNLLITLPPARILLPQLQTGRNVSVGGCRRGAQLMTKLSTAQEYGRRRRDVLASAFASVGLGVLGSSRLDSEPAPKRDAPISPKDNLKITKLETILVKPRWLFLKIHTNAGIVGLGEPITEGRALTCAEAVKEVEPYLVGKDPRPVAKHWQAIYRHAFYRGGPILTSALSGIDQALWDIKGKALGVPVYELLGGPTRDRIRVYAHAGTTEQMKKLQGQGFSAFKTGVAKKTTSPLH